MPKQCNNYKNKQNTRKTRLEVVKKFAMTSAKRSESADEAGCGRKGCVCVSVQQKVAAVALLLRGAVNNLEVIKEIKNY